jgi:hypothetical protein
MPTRVCGEWKKTLEERRALAEDRRQAAEAELVKVKAKR